jgi:hypothetical protein
MDMDQVAAELRRVTEHIGSLDVEAVSSAEGILGLPRYAAAEHPAKALVADLKQIIAALPSDMKMPARLLFSLSEKGTNISHRKKQSRVEGSGWKWLRDAVLQRITVAILADPDDNTMPLLGPSGFRVESLSISTSFRTPGALVGLPVVELAWQVERTHPRAQIFTFYFDTHHPIFDWKAQWHRRALDEVVKQVSAVQIDASRHRHFFALDLGDPPDDRIGLGESVVVALSLKPPCKQLQFLEYPVYHPMTALGFHVIFPKLRQECELVEFESDAADAPIVSKRTRSPIAERFYTVSAWTKPIVGRRYRLIWEPQDQHLLTRLLPR